MNWIRFSQCYPDSGDDEILIYDGQEMFMGYTFKDQNGYRVASSAQYCNNKKCNYTSDTCWCDIELNDNSWWMPLPKKPDARD